MGRSQKVRGVDRKAAQQKLPKVVLPFVPNPQAEEGVRPAAMDWMNETLEYDQIVARDRLNLILQREERKRLRIEERREARIEFKHARRVARRAQVRRPKPPRQQQIVVQETGLPVQHAASYRVVCGKREDVTPRMVKHLGYARAMELLGQPNVLEVSQHQDDLAVAVGLPSIL